MDKNKIKQYLVKKANEEAIGQAMEAAQGNPQLAAAMLGVPVGAVIGALHGGAQGLGLSGVHGLMSKAHGQPLPKGGIWPGMKTAGKWGAGIGAGIGAAGMLGMGLMNGR